MTDDSTHPAVERINRDAGFDLVGLLADGLSGTDSTSLLLEVMRRRSAGISSADVLRRYSRDRFVRPAVVDVRRVLDLERLAIDVLGEVFTPVALSPLVPFGTHHALGGVSQHRVVSTIRSTEVAADPTCSLACEAADRRRALLAVDARSREVVRLMATQRVVRAQQVEGPRSFAHFALLGMVSAGRDAGNRAFEYDSLHHHVQSHVDLVIAAGFGDVIVALTDFGATETNGLDTLRRLAAELSTTTVVVELRQDRTAGRGYYAGMCFKVSVRSGADDVEVADGGHVAWTRSLLGNAKERLMTSGLSLERLAMLA